MAANVPGQISPDGAYYWDGRQWVTTLSRDGAHRWNGSAWVPTSSSSIPLPPQPPAATYAGRPAGARAGRPSTSSLAFQLGGPAAWSIVVGIVAILLPIVSAALSARPYYFVVLPIFGFIRGASALSRGRVLGGAIGMAANAVGGLVSLLAGGLIQP